MDTIQTVRTELQRRKGDWPTLCKTAGLSYWWLTKFVQGRIREPGLSKIERLQAYIAANPLEKSDSPGKGGPEDVAATPAKAGSYDEAA